MFVVCSVACLLFVVRFVSVSCMLLYVCGCRMFVVIRVSFVFIVSCWFVFIVWLLLFWCGVWFALCCALFVVRYLLVVCSCLIVVAVFFLFLVCCWLFLVCYSFAVVCFFVVCLF